MLIIPAVDVKNGQCVRLAQGDFNRVTVYAENPADVASRWAQKGAKRIHLVDLDGSVAGLPKNAPVIVEIAQSVPVPVEVGGGIRSMETVNYYLENGVSSVILGTAAIQDESFVRTAARTHREKSSWGSTRSEGRSRSAAGRKRRARTRSNWRGAMPATGSRPLSIRTLLATAWRRASMWSKPGLWRKPSIFR